MLRPVLAAMLTGAALFGASAAQAGTHWSIGINLPPAGVLVSNGPGYYVAEPAPVYYAPPPVVYAPPPVFYAPPPPSYIERDIYYAPPPRVVYETSYRDRRWDDRDDRREWRGHGRHEHRWDRDRDDYGPRRWR